MRPPSAPLVLVVLLVAGTALAPLRWVTGAAIPLAANGQGSFIPDGQIPGEARPPAGTRLWTSWGGDETARGSLLLAIDWGPALMGFYTAGFPRGGGNSIVLVRVADGVEFRPLVEDSFDAWHFTRVELPPAFQGVPIQVRAHRAPGTWLAMTEPTAIPAWVGWWNGTLSKLTVLVSTACVLLLLSSVTAAVALQLQVRSDLVAPVSLAAVVGIGYLVFWAFLVGPRTGRAAAWAVALAAAAAWSRPSARARIASVWRLPEWRRPVALMATIGVMYFGITTLFGGERWFTHVARERFLTLAADNAIPHYFAERLLNGQSPLQLLGDWLSSDRPPLQTGFVLLLTPLLPVRSPDVDLVGQMAGVWFQLLWVPAVWGWLRAIGASARTATLVIAGSALTGVLLVNSVFVWPKLGAGALMLTAFLLWFVPPAAPRRRATWALAGTLASLAWLSHGATAFALIAVTPFALARLRNTGLRPWLVSAFAFVVWSAPWTAYQRFYDPPGNRLLKWHLAGVKDVDPRGTLQTLRDSYGELTPGQWWDGRKTNLAAYLNGRWSDLTRFDFSRRIDRLWDESYWLFYSLGWWNVGWVALGGKALGWRRRNSGHPGSALAVLWVIVTILVTSLLLFEPGGTLIHQGSYTILLILLPLCALALWRVHPAVFAGAAAAQCVTFVGVWLPCNDDFADGRLDIAAAAITAAAAAGLLALAMAGRFEDDSDSSREPLAA